MTGDLIAVCDFCGREAEAVGVESSLDLAAGYPPNALQAVPTGRLHHRRGVALLHHECATLGSDWPRDEPYWASETAWWACKDPERSLDDNAHYDLYCAACAVRWAMENRT